MSQYGVLGCSLVGVGRIFFTSHLPLCANLRRPVKNAAENVKKMHEKRQKRHLKRLDSSSAIYPDTFRYLKNGYRMVNKINPQILYRDISLISIY